MSRKRNPNPPEPPWVATMSDQEIVEKIQTLVGNPNATYERIGSLIVDMRKRIVKILIDGLAAKEIAKD